MSVTFCLQRIPVILASVGIAATAFVAPAAPTARRSTETIRVREGLGI